MVRRFRRMGRRRGTTLLWRWLLRGQLRQLVSRRLGWRCWVLDRPGAWCPERVGSERAVLARLRVQLRTRLLDARRSADLECLELLELGPGIAVELVALLGLCQPLRHPPDADGHRATTG